MMQDASPWQAEAFAEQNRGKSLGQLLARSTSAPPASIEKAFGSTGDSLVGNVRSNLVL